LAIYFKTRRNTTIPFWKHNSSCTL